MATSTLCRQRQKTGSWASIFPTEQVTEQQSALFVKKLLAVAISNVTYLRTIFPEHAFGDRCLEDLNLKILRDDSTCPGACQVIQWVKGCFDALDKKYLKTIVVGIYADADSPDTAVETYTFRFSYTSGEGIAIFRNDSEVASAYTETDTRKATIKLLRTIVVLTQTLKPLPDDVMMTMKLLYYDDVTPVDYEPPGFQSTTVDSFSFHDDPVAIRVGDVSTPFHTVKLRIRTECQQFSLCEEGRCEKGGCEEGGCDTEGSSKQQERPEVTATGDHTPLSQHQHPEPVSGDTSSAAAEPLSPAHLPPSPPDEGEHPVCCPCGCNEDDGLMVLCGGCHAWQHAVCFALLAEDKVPDMHLCVQCSQGSGKVCTDPFLQFLSPVALQATCLWRRALLAATETSRILTPSFARRLGVEMTVAQGLVNRLEKEGFVRAPAKGKRLGKVVNKDKIHTKGMPKYFETAHRPDDDSREEARNATSTVEPHPPPPPPGRGRECDR